MKKLVSILIFASLFIQLFGQTIHFSGTQTWMYRQPILLDGKWDAIYDSDGRQPNSGTINIDEKAKIFIVTDENGLSIRVHINKIETVQEDNIDFGNVTKTTYYGTSISSNSAAKLVDMETIHYDHIIRLYMKRIINTGVVIQGKEVKFDDWECYLFKTLFLNISF